VVSSEKVRKRLSVSARLHKMKGGFPRPCCSIKMLGSHAGWNFSLEFWRKVVAIGRSLKRDEVSPEQVQSWAHLWVDPKKECAISG